MVASIPGDGYRTPLIEGNVGYESPEAVLLLERSHGTPGGRYRQEST